MRKLLILGAALMLTACATPTGPDAAGSFDRFRVVTTKDFRSYDRVQVLPPEAGPEVLKRVDARRYRVNERPISQRDLDAQLADLEQSLIQAVGREAQIVQQGGEGVLTIAATVTDLNANRPTQAELAAEPGLSLQSIATGDSAVRIELSENGRVLAVIEDRDNVNSLADPEAQVAGIWTTARRHFNRVSANVAALLRD